MTPAAKKAEMLAIEAVDGLPCDAKEWNTHVKFKKLTESSLKSVKPQSASEAHIEQFYMLKTTYAALKSRSQLWEDLYINAESVTKVQTLLNGSTLWQDYKISFNEATPSQSLFGLVQLYQRRSVGGIAHDRPRRVVDLNTGQIGGAPKETLNTEASFTSLLTEFSELTIDGIPASLAVEDEEIVNFGLVLFLNALVQLTPSVDISGDWWPCRSKFTIPNKKKKYKAYSATVDGIFRVEGVSAEVIRKQRDCKKKYQTLRPMADKPITARVQATKKHENSEEDEGDKEDEHDEEDKGDTEDEYDEEDNGDKEDGHNKKDKMITMIVEVKRASRLHSQNSWRQKILIQEAAEMAAWISEVPMLVGQRPDEAGEYRRLLISQDQREVFITIATYTEEYIHYIMNSIDKPAYQENEVLLSSSSFLTMQPYGPFRMDEWNGMAELAEWILALSYQNYII